MAAFIRHRRFMEDSTNIGDKICDFQCDPDHNPTGICFANCAATCPSFCHITDRSRPPSSSPSPAFSPYSQIPPSAQNHRQLSFPLKISLIFLMATFVYTLYKIFTVWYRSRHQPTASPPSLENQETIEENHDLDHHIWYIRTAGLQLSEISAITVAKYNKGDGFVVGTDCTVCLSEFEADEAVRLLPKCKHAFHVSCIDTWLGSHTNCPLCRAGIVNIDPPLPEQNSDDFGTNLRISVLVDDDREEASGSSELTVMETDEDDVNGNSGMGFQSRDGVSEIELVKIEH